MYRQMQQEDPRNEILLAMLMVDQQRTGFISVAELQAKLMNLGEKLSKEEGESPAKISVPWPLEEGLSQSQWYLGIWSSFILGDATNPKQTR